MTAEDTANEAGMETGYTPAAQIARIPIPESRTGPSRAVAIGIFDGVHLGHQEILRETVRIASEQDWIPSVLTFSGMPAAKGGTGKCICGMDEKAEELDACGIKEMIIAAFASVRDMDCRTFVEDILLTRLGTGAVVVGEDFRFGKNRTGDASLLRTLLSDHGVACGIVPSLLCEGEKIASSAIRVLLESGNLEQAIRRMGHPVSFILPVVPGSHIGRTIGYPTINQVIPPERQTVRYGVYAVSVDTGDGRYPGVCNIGVKPTVGGTVPLAETYIHGFSGDLYGKTVKISLLRFLRPEQVFPGLEQLREQIQKDISAVIGTEIV